MSEGIKDSMSSTGEQDPVLGNVIMLDRDSVRSGLGTMLKHFGRVYFVMPSAKEVDRWRADGGPERLTKLKQEAEQGGNDE